MSDADRDGLGKPRGPLEGRTGAAVGALGLAIMAGIGFWATRGGDPPAQEARPHLQRVLSLQPMDDVDRPAPPPPPPPPPARREEPPPPPAPPAMPASAPALVQTRPASPQTMVSFAAPQRQAPAASPAPRATTRQPEGSAATVGPVGGHVAQASAPRDVTRTLMPGLYRCQLMYPVVSERPGPFFCQVVPDEPWLSPAGVPLAPTGTRIQGTYSAEVGRAQSRINAVSAEAWTEADETGKAVHFTIGGPMAGTDGSVGLNGEVDRHTWQRFSGAALLFLGQGAMSAAQAAIQGAVSNNGGTYVSVNTSSLDQAISAVLRDGLNIQNTVTARAGEMVGVFVTKAIDFSAACRPELLRYRRCR